MIKEPQITTQTLKVLNALNAVANLSGADIARSTGLATGTLYPILLRLEAAGWLSSEWEAGDPKQLRRPRKRFYQITGEGARKARAAVAELQTAIGGLAWA